MIVNISIQGKNAVFTAQFYDNPTARELYSRLPMTLGMSAMAHEKYYYLEQSLPTDSERISRIDAGDIMLWGNDCLVVFYESFDTTYSYTRIGRISDVSGLAEFLGSGDATLTFTIGGQD